jgi:ADP-ribose pyrophosphatase YjhB (NUDIX family)
MNIWCKQKCCNLKVDEYKPVYNNERKKKSKAGVFIFDPESKKILLVQSRGNFWGPPKGTMQYGETWVTCAVREVIEETGFKINPSNFTKATKIKGSSLYFFLEMKECAVNVQTKIEGNDANGIGWLKIDCLFEMINNEQIKINKNCKILINHFLKDYL